MLTVHLLQYTNTALGAYPALRIRRQFLRIPACDLETPVLQHIPSIDLLHTHTPLKLVTRMSSIACAETTQPLAKLPTTLKGEATDSTLLNLRPISPLVITTHEEDVSHAPKNPKTVVVITVCAT